MSISGPPPDQLRHATPGTAKSHSSTIHKGTPLAQRREWSRRPSRGMLGNRRLSLDGTDTNGGGHAMCHFSQDCLRDYWAEGESGEGRTLPKSSPLWRVEAREEAIDLHLSALDQLSTRVLSSDDCGHESFVCDLLVMRVDRRRTAMVWTSWRQSIFFLFFLFLFFSFLLIPFSENALV